MKSRDIEIGATYTAKVSARLVEVTIMSEYHRPDSLARGGVRKLWRARNLSSGRVLEISAARLRSKVLTDAERAQLVRDRNTWLASALSGAAWCLYGARLNPAKRSARLCVEVAS
jgi:hypothetical protein